MIELLWLVPLFPLIGFLILALAKGLAPSQISLIGVGSVCLSMMAAGAVSLGLMEYGFVNPGYRQRLWTWFDVAGFSPQIGFYLDSLSLLMIVVVTGVGFLIHVYSVGYMAEDKGYQRFMAYMNLFVAAMLTLVLADNLLLLFLGWEGVGLCSYLLIGFWYHDASNGQAARKAFIMNRIGDAALLIGLCLLVMSFGTLDIQNLMRQVSRQWSFDSPLAITVSLLLLAGAIGKSAQLPLQTWLPDAMAGPTPVSALLHAATMVTAGVYLLARSQVLFQHAPTVQHIVAIIGVVTLLLSALSALVQRNIKRVLAFSTISQIGYMFLALGVGAASAAMFHFMTHAFFKALLFLGAGAVIMTLHHEQDLFKMGGLRTQLPLAFWTILIGTASLAGVPFITAGFFSKERILWEVWSSPTGGSWLWAAGVLGVLLTSLYGFRLVFLVFYGEKKTEPEIQSRGTISIPLLILAVLSVGGGWVELQAWGNLSFSHVIHTALPVHNTKPGVPTNEGIIKSVTTVVSLLGIVLAYLIFLRFPDKPVSIAATQTVGGFRYLALRGWMFNRLYQSMFVKLFVRAAKASKQDIFDRWYDRYLVNPFLRVAEISKEDLIDQTYEWLSWLIRQSNRVLQSLQTGRVRWYATVFTAGSVAILTILVYA